MSVSASRVDITALRKLQAEINTSIDSYVLLAESESPDEAELEKARDGVNSLSGQLYDESTAPEQRILQWGGTVRTEKRMYGASKEIEEC